MITFTINGTRVQAEEGQHLIQVAEKYGFEIPTLCHHKGLDPAGLCRLCTVELFDGRRTKFVTACNYPVWEGMEIQTETEAVHQGRKMIVELLMARCPEVPIIKELAGKYGLEQSRFPAEDDDCILCGLCTRICDKMGNNAITLTGRGLNLQVDTPFSQTSDVCLACGACASVCPTGHISLDKIRTEITKARPELIPSEYDMGLKGRKPVYVPYAQAVPNTPAIDREVCVHFKTGGCQICQEFCQTNAIDYSMEDETVELEVGSIILSPGFQPFDPSKFDTYSYSEFQNVVTALEFERILAATGPWMGHLVRPGDEKEPKKIAFLQCVGSREINRCDHPYCSSVCCMYALKESIIAKEHADYDLDVAIYYMDMRTHGKDFDRYYERARDKGVRFIRSRVHTILELPDQSLRMDYLAENGEKLTEDFDLVVLSHGMEISDNVKDLAQEMGIELNSSGFVKSSDFAPVGTNIPGIYACGALAGPKDIPQSVMEASAAACAASSRLSEVRNSQTLQPEIPEQIDVVGEIPRIGVFICSCGINIAGVIDVNQLVDYAQELPHVAYVNNNLFTCSQDSQEAMASIIKEQGLNRVVVAACTPKTHEGIFQETLQGAGLNRYLFEMANIRNQDSWVHANNPRLATQKAEDLIRMAVTKVALSAPLQEVNLEITPVALIVGGGIAGMNAALEMAGQGFETHLVEQSNQLGGNARLINSTVNGQKVAPYLQELQEKLESNSLVHLHLDSTLSNVEGFVGNYTSEVTDARGDVQEIKHGAVIVATGAQEHTPEEYSYGQDPRVMTHLEIDSALKQGSLDPTSIGSAVFIQCVGSREPERPYCSKICCTHTLKSALHFKEQNPDCQIYVLYRDIRSYGDRELLYKAAREKGIIFIRFEPESKPTVETTSEGLHVSCFDPILGRDVAIKADCVGLASAVLSRDNTTLAQQFKLPLNEDGWFMEAHQKLRPVDFATDGVFMAGTCHYPKPIEESISQAQAAVSRAVSLLSREELNLPGTVAAIMESKCVACGLCIEICPYQAIDWNEKGLAQINRALCKGCGTCVASCRSGAPNLNGFTQEEIFAEIEALV